MSHQIDFIDDYCKRNLELMFAIFQLVT